MIQVRTLVCPEPADHGSQASPLSRPAGSSSSAPHNRGLEESCFAPDSCLVLLANHLVFKACLPTQAVNSRVGGSHLTLVCIPNRTRGAGTLRCLTNARLSSI